MELCGKYRPIAHLGRGGMADVFLTIAGGPSGYNFSKLLVVKRLRASTADDPELVTMFVDEGRILAHLRHPNIVQIVEVGLHGKEAFLAMEYLDGLSLRRLRQRAQKENVDVPREVEVVALVDVLTALDHAYELVTWDGQQLRIVHRDVTPHNVIVTVDGQVKVLDFGIAKTALRDTVTASGIIKGKLRYMSPEQASAREVGRASDIFSVGIMLWEALTKQRFWAALDEHEIARRLIAGEIDSSPRAVDPSVPDALDRICRRALAYRPGDRYPTATAMREDIEAHLGDTILDARKKLGPVVQRLAEKDRAKLRAVIEHAARRQAETEADAVETTTVMPTVVDALPPAASVDGPRVTAARTAPRRALFVLPLVAAFLAAGVAQGVVAYRGRARATTPVPAFATTPREELALAADGKTHAPDEVDDAADADVDADAARQAAVRVGSVVPARRLPLPSRKARAEASTKPGATGSRDAGVALDPTDPWRSDPR